MGKYIMAEFHYIDLDIRAIYGQEHAHVIAK